MAIEGGYGFSLHQAKVGEEKQIVERIMGNSNSTITEDPALDPNPATSNDSATPSNGRPSNGQGSRRQSKLATTCTTLLMLFCLFWQLNRAEGFIDIGAISSNLVNRLFGPTTQQTAWSDDAQAKVLNNIRMATTDNARNYWGKVLQQMGGAPIPGTTEQPMTTTMQVTTEQPVTTTMQIQTAYGQTVRRTTAPTTTIPTTMPTTTMGTTTPRNMKSWTPKLHRSQTYATTVRRPETSTPKTSTWQTATIRSTAWTTSPPQQTTQQPTTEMPTMHAHRREVETTTVASQTQVQRKHQSINQGGLDVYWCAGRGGTLFKLKESEHSAFCRPPPTITSRWTKTRINLYMRIIKPEPVQSAWHCAAKRVTVNYYTNLLGDKIKIPPVVEHLPIDGSQCNRIAILHECPFTDKDKWDLEQQDDGTWATDDVLNLDYPGAISGLFKGLQTASATNCFAQPASLYLRHHNMELISPVHNVHSCHFINGFCVILNGTLIWDTHCLKNGGGYCKPCDYENVDVIDGDFTTPHDGSPTTWVSDDRQKALTFAEEPEEVIACDGNTVVLSEQGFGILADQFHAAMSTRMARSVEPEQLASQITAAQVSTNMALGQLFWRECQRTWRFQNPTLQARKLLNSSNLQARWLSENTMEVFSCAIIPLVDVEYKASNVCYTYIPVLVNYGDNRFHAYLDPELRILSSTAPKASCGNFRTQYLQLKKDPDEWITIDTTTGVAKRLSSSRIHELYESLTSQAEHMLELHPVYFHRWILKNDSELPVFAHIQEWASYENFKDENKEHQESGGITLSALPGGITGAVEQWLLDWLAWFVQLWIKLCCVYVTLLFLRDVAIPLMLAYVLNPIKVTLLSLLGRRQRQVIPKSRFFKRRQASETELEEVPVPVRRQLLQPFTQQTSGNNDQQSHKETVAIEVHPQKARAFFKPRARSATIEERVRPSNKNERLYGNSRQQDGTDGD